MALKYGPIVALARLLPERFRLIQVRACLLRSSANKAEFRLNPWEAVVYPNPGKGQFNVSLRNITETGSLAISLRDITGREVASTVFSELTPGAEELTIPLFWEGLSAGVYTLQLRSATQNQTLRLAIEP
jgi:hypothetical protein